MTLYRVAVGPKIPQDLHSLLYTV